ncbi:UNVERIFIED_CONTAM: hypothetical protein HDU68_011482 [Siphonaria sp. JEL0065]|nr:hypothetical protein HDU68_011482 [Siphonaria sp. JEL0065]
MQVAETLSLSLNGTTSACVIRHDQRVFVGVGSRDGLVTIHEVGGSFQRVLTHSPRTAFPASGSSSSNANAAKGTNGAASAVSALTFETHSGRLVSAAEDGSLVVFGVSVTDGLAFHRIHSMQRAHAAAVSAVVFETADAVAHASAHAAPAPSLHRSPSLNDLRDPAEHQDRLYTASFDKCVHQWDLVTGKKTRIFSGHTRPVLCLAVHAGRVFSGSMDGSVRVWDSQLGDCLHVLQMDTDVLALSAGINVLYAGGRDGGLRVWNVSAGKLVKVLGAIAPPASTLTAGAPAATSSTISPLTSDNEVEYVKPESNNSRQADESLGGSIVDTIIQPIQRRASNLGLGTLFSSATQSLFGHHSTDPSQLPPGHKPSAVRTVSIGLLPGQVFSAGDDAIIYEWDVKSGAIMRKFDNHSAGILWVFVEKPFATASSYSGGSGRLYSASLDGCVRVFEIEGGSTSKQFPITNYKPPPRATNKEVSRRASTPVFSSTATSFPHNSTPLRSSSPLNPYDQNQISPFQQPPRNISPFQESTAASDPTAASTIATLRAQLERAHTLLSTQSQVTHRLKSELTVTRSHIATIKNELNARNAEVTILKGTGLEEKVRKLEKEAKDGRDAALVALEYITRQGSTVGLEIEVEVMGVMRLLESPWTPLGNNGEGEGLIGGGIKNVKRCWESDSEFDSEIDVDQEVDEGDAWWRADILKVVEPKPPAEAPPPPPNHPHKNISFREGSDSELDTTEDSTEDEEDDILIPPRNRKRTHRWSTMSLTRPVLAYHESFNKRSSGIISSNISTILELDSDDTEDEVIVPSIPKRSSFNGSLSGGASSPWTKGFLERIPEDDDYLEDHDAVGLLGNGIGGLQNIGDHNMFLGTGLNTSDAIEMLAMTDMESISSSVNADNELSPMIQHLDGGSEAVDGGLSKTDKRMGVFRQSGLYDVASSGGVWPMSPEREDGGLVEVPVLDNLLMGGLAIHPMTPPATPKQDQHDSAVDVTPVLTESQPRPQSRLGRPSSRLMWHQPVEAVPVNDQEPEIVEVPVLEQKTEDDLPDIIWSGSVKPVVSPPAPTSTAQAVFPDDSDLGSVVWTGNVKSVKGATKPTTALPTSPLMPQSTLTPEEQLAHDSVIFTGTVKSKKAPVTTHAEIQAQQQQEDFIADAESIVWKGSVKSKKASRKHAQSVAANNNNTPSETLDDAESIVWRGAVKSKKSTTKAAKSMAGSIGEDDSAAALDDAESIVWRGAVKSKKSTTKAAKSTAGGSYAGDDAESIVFRGTVKSKRPNVPQSLAESTNNSLLEDAESIVWKGNVKSKKSTTKKAKSIFSNNDEDEEDSGSEVASVRPSQPPPAVAVASSPIVMDSDLESVMWQGSVRSTTKAIPKLSSSLKQSAVFPLDQETVGEGSDGASSVLPLNMPTPVPKPSGFGDFAKVVPPPVPQPESVGFFSAILKPIMDTNNQTVPIPRLEPINQVKPKSSLSWFTSTPVESEPEQQQQQPQQQPPVPSNQVKPKASSSWFTGTVEDELPAVKMAPVPTNQVKPKASSSWFSAVTGIPDHAEEEAPAVSTASVQAAALVPRPPPTTDWKAQATTATTTTTVKTTTTTASTVTSSWFTPLTSILQAITDLVPDEEEFGSLRIANTEDDDQVLFEAEIDGKKWQKSDSNPTTRERPLSLIKPRPASVIKTRPTSVLLNKRPASVLRRTESSSSIKLGTGSEAEEDDFVDALLPMRPKSVMRRPGSSLSMRADPVYEDEESEVEEFKSPMGEFREEEEDERPTRKSFMKAVAPTAPAAPFAAISSVRRCKSLDSRPVQLSTPTFNTSRRHSISFGDKLQDSIPKFLKEIAEQKRQQLRASINARANADDNASEASSSRYSSLSTPCLSDEERPLTPTRTTNSQSALSHSSNNGRIKKRGSVSSSLHSEYTGLQQQVEYTAPKPGPPQRRKSSFKPISFDTGVSADSPAVDQLAAALESVLEAAIETPWHLVPKWLVIDEGAQPNDVEEEKEEVVNGEKLVEAPVEQKEVEVV